MANLIANSVCLDYPIYNVSAKSFRRAYMDRIVGGELSDQVSSAVTVRALDQVSFEINEGDSVALLGHNGAGKTTLLRVLAGLFKPTQGSVETTGSIATLIDLGIGLDQNATGLENIRFFAAVKGMTEIEINNLIQDVQEFSDLGDFINLPLRVYSAGMKTRLMFAMATSGHSEISLVDEVFGAGDANFREKANSRMIEYLERAKVVVFSTHSIDLARKFCNKALILERGRVTAFGKLEEVL